MIGTSGDHGTIKAGMEVLASLRGLRRRVRAVLLGSRICALVATVLAVALFLGLTDYFLRLPEWIRWLHWFGGIGALAWAVRRYVRPAWRFHPSLTDLALRAESLRPEVQGLLASAADFATGGDASRGMGGSGVSKGLSAMVLERASAAWRDDDAARIIRTQGLWNRGGLALLAILLALAPMLASPPLWSIGASRLLAPWSGAAWPKRTGVVDLTLGDVHARGTALPLRAGVVKSNRAWDNTYVAVEYRTITDGETGASRRELLTWQQRTTSETLPDAAGAELFERLVEPAGDAIEFRFVTDDDRTDWRRMELVPPPAIASARARITPPSYVSTLAREISGTAASADSIDADLGPGTDDRAVAPQALAGSRIEMTIELNKPLPLSPDLAAMLGEDARASADGSTWRLAWTLAESVRLPITLIDEHGIASMDESVYRFDSLQDRPAAATITDPSTDRTVLPTAVVPVIGEGRDDVGLAWVGIERIGYTPAGAQEKSGPGGAMQPMGEPIMIARTEAVGQSQALATASIELGPLGLKPGDEVRISALAIDILASTDGTAPTRSAPRTLRIISEADLITELQSQLAEVRQAAIRIEQQQDELKQKTESGAADGLSRRGQGQVTERIARQREQVQRLIERITENQLGDRGLRDLLGRADGALQDAGSASNRAASALEGAARPDKPGTEERSDPKEQNGETASRRAAGARQGSETGGDQQTASGSPEGQGAEQPAKAGQSGAPGAEGARGKSDQEQEAEASKEPASRPITPDERAAAEAQQEVQDELRQLVELLDRGEDDWLVRNAIERLIDEQGALREQTSELGRRTAGRETDQLSQQERSELDEIVQKQSELAEETRSLTEDIREREQKLREKDPTAAQGLAQAARRAEQSRVSEKMQSAASQAAQNQTAQASRQQQQAEQDLQEMLEDLDQASKAREEVLRRMLATIIESIEGLVAQQEGELAALERAVREKAGLDGLDAGMIRLNQNTLGVVDVIRAGGAELAPVATLVSRAADAQSSAITELRRPILGATAVREMETRSLELLKQALAKAQEIDEQAADRQNQKKLNELKKVYREILERQVRLLGETERFADVEELSRRDKQQVRGLGEEQAQIGADLAGLLTQTGELREARVFDYAHKRLDAFSTRASESLGASEPRAAAPAQRSLVQGLQALLEALQDPKPDQKDQQFSESGGGGGGGGQQQAQLIPPAKELKLLRSIQQDLAGRTNELAGREGGAVREEFEELGREQRDLMKVGEEFLDRLSGGEQMEKDIKDKIGPGRPDQEGDQEQLQKEPEGE